MSEHGGPQSRAPERPATENRFLSGDLQLRILAPGSKLWRLRSRSNYGVSVPPALRPDGRDLLQHRPSGQPTPPPGVPSPVSSRHLRPLTYSQLVEHQKPAPQVQPLAGESMYTSQPILPTTPVVDCPAVTGLQ